MDTLPCSGRTSLFFSEDVRELAEAERICREECHVREACAEMAERLQPACGVWGGKRYHKGRQVGRVREQNKSRPYGWTPTMDAEVLELRQRGMTWGQISMALGRCEDTCRERYGLLTTPQPVGVPVENMHP